MRRLQIMMDEDLDAGLERQALEEGTSKAALVRRFVREKLRPLPPLEEDPLYRMIGACSFEPIDNDAIDEIVYG